MIILKARRANLNDAHVVKKLLDAASTVPASKGIEQWTAPFSIESIESNITMIGGIYMFYRNTIDVIGTVDCRYEDEAVWGAEMSSAIYIHRLAINPAYSGNHFGEQILDWVVSKAQAENIKFVRLDCVAHNRKLRRYYEAYGFKYIRNANQFELPSALYELHL